MRIASNKNAPKMEPMTIPAIAPPDSVRRCEVVAAVELGNAELVGDDVGLAVENTMDEAEVTAIGKTTPWQILSVFEYRQQESVAFGELDAQYEHRPLRLSL